MQLLCLRGILNHYLTLVVVVRTIRGGDQQETIPLSLFPSFPPPLPSFLPSLIANLRPSSRYVNADSRLQLVAQGWRLSPSPRTLSLSRFDSLERSSNYRLSSDPSSSTRTSSSPSAGRTSSLLDRLGYTVEGRSPQVRRNWSIPNLDS